MSYKDKDYHKNYYIKNIDKIKEYRENNCEKIKKYGEQYGKQYWVDNKERLSKQKKQYYEENKNIILKKCKRYRDDNQEQTKKACKKWRKDNPEKVRMVNSKWKKERHKIDLKYNLNKKISETIRTSLKGNKNGRHWEDLVGYILNDLIKRLKKTLPVGYGWQAFMEGKLHIDHIIPISAFNFTKSEHPDFKRAWALKNLQLLPARENIIKSNHLTRPFQPALKLKVYVLED